MTSLSRIKEKENLNSKPKNRHISGKREYLFRIN